MGEGEVTTPPPPPVFQAEERGGGGGVISLSPKLPVGWKRKGPTGGGMLIGPPIQNWGNGGPHVKKNKKQKPFFFLLIMIHLQMTISPSFLIRFRCFWAHWKALDE